MAEPALGTRLRDLDAEAIALLVALLLKEHVVDEEEGSEQRRLALHVQIHRETENVVFRSLVFSLGGECSYKFKTAPRTLKRD